jgi:hypothetical protein
MKSTTAFLVATSAALASAQVTFNSTTGKYNCAKPNVAYCAGDSLKTDIIIRCDANSIGQPGRCTDNLDGEPPVGLFTALCWTSGATAGDAACEKNCVVYGGSGNANGTFTLPADMCTPTFTATSTTVSSTTTVVSPTSTVYPTSSITITTSASSCLTLSTATGTGGGSGGSGSGNGTYSGTAIPPTKTGPTTIPTAGASVNQVGGALAILGFAAAYLA